MDRQTDKPERMGSFYFQQRSKCSSVGKKTVLEKLTIQSRKKKKNFDSYSVLFKQINSKCIIVLT